MSAKKLILDFYKSDALINSEILDTFLHPEIVLDWHSSKGFFQMRREDLLTLAIELNRSYIRSKVKISHLIKEGDLISIRYSHYVKTVENPREDILLAEFMVIWEIKDEKLYRGFQMSQIS
jgi:predicted SnoaL-like aldol condensation-catalyzing enzyme